MKCEECGSNAVSEVAYDYECTAYECEACGVVWEECPDDYEVIDDSPDEDLNDLGYPID